MRDVTTKIVLDKRRILDDGTYPVKLRVTSNRDQRYYGVGMSFTVEDFDKMMSAQRRSREQKQTYNKLTYFLNRANDVIDGIDVFTFDKFKERFFESRDVNKSVSYAFDKYIEDLRQEKRLGTAESYEYAKRSLESFKSNLEFSTITPRFLQKYENWMLDNGRSKTTIGIYLRSLRTIFNLQDIDGKLYPFGEEKNKKYSIPTGRNIKKALTLEEIGKLYNYEAEPYSREDQAKDYWMFLYLCNGLNVKDFCLLKWKNIEGDILTYKREKTKRSKTDSKPIEVSLKAETREILKKWSVKSINREAFIFPHLTNEMTADEQRKAYKQVNRMINKYIRRIAEKIGIDKNITSYYARHSFATVLKRSGTNIAMISDLLGHSNIKTTESYLGSFEKEQIHQQTDNLLNFPKAN